MTAPVTTDGRVLVGAYGDVYTAPEGTAAPTNLDDPGSPWTKLGLVSEDGATWTPPTEETTDIKAWQSPYPQRIVTTSLTTSLHFALMEWDRETLPFALGGGSFTDSGDVTTYHPPAAGAAASRALFMKVLDSPVKMGVYYPKGRVTERGDSTFKPDEAALLDVTFGIEGSADTSVDPYNILFDSATFPPDGGAPDKGSASPGDIFPAEATITAEDATNAAKLAGLGYVAAPTTAWTTGQAITIGTYRFHWTSTAWASGLAA